MRGFIRGIILVPFLLLAWPTTSFAQSIVSDQFTGSSLNESVWTFVDPLGDGQFSVAGDQLMLSVPGGTVHDVWTKGNHAPRVMQYVPDQDFEIEVKFDSSMSQQFQMQGVVVEDASGDFVRTEFHHDGSRTRVFSAVVQGGSASVKANLALSGVVAPMYLRLAREGAVWTHRYSIDGVNWQTAATFTHAMTMHAVGVYGGNAGRPAPAHVATVDYFVNLAIPSDPGPVDPSYNLAVNVSGSGSVLLDPPGGVYAAGTVVTLTASAAAGWSFAGWSGALTGVANPASVTVNGETAIEAVFVADPVPEYGLAVNVSGSGSVLLDPPGGVYAAGTVVTLTASAAAGWSFAGWSGALTGVANPASVTVNGETAIEAVFVADPVPEYGLAVNVSGSGSVLLDPPGGVYAAGTVVTLTASAAAGWSFAGWSGALTGVANPASVTVNGETAIEAVFVADPVPEYGLAVNVSGSGSVLLDPPGGVYAAGTVVTLTASAAAGWSFAGWSGALTGSSNPEQVLVDDYVVVTATFEVTAVAPAISGLSVNPESDRARVSWQTDQPTTGRVDYGETFAYGTGSVVSNVPAISHEVALLGLRPETTYHLRVTAQAQSGLESQSESITFTTAASQTGQIQSDHFSGTSLNESVWTFVDPVGDGQFSVAGDQLMLVVPGGVVHDIWTKGNDAPRVMQYVPDQDFEIEVKFDSSMTQQFQMQGVVVEDASGGFVRTEFHHDGSRTRVFSAVVQGGSASVKANLALSGVAGPMYLRLAREGTIWTHRYSSDGVNWQTATSFSHAMTMRAVGVYGGNAGSSAPAHVATVDYFVNLAIPSDPGPGDPSYSLAVNVTGAGAVVLDPPGGIYSAGTSVELTAVPADGWEFAGWSGTLTGLQNPATVIINGNGSITGAFVASSTGGGPFALTDIQVQSTGPMSALVSWNSNEPATSRVDYGIGNTLGATRYSGDYVNQHQVEVGWLRCEQIYSLEVTARSIGGVEAKSGRLSFSSPSCPNAGLGMPPTIQLWSDDVLTFGDRGRSQRWINILGRVSSAHALASVSFRVNGGTARSLSLGPNLKRLASKGDFNVEIDYEELVLGANSIEIRAEDVDGRVSTQGVSVTRVDSPPVPLPYLADWGQGSGVETFGYAVDGDWSVNNARVAANTLDYDRLLVLGDVDWTDYEVTVPVTVF
jgi:hypothetical protein